MVNNLDVYLLEHKQRLQQCEKKYTVPSSGRRFRLHLPSLKQLRALLFL